MMSLKFCYSLILFLFLLLSTAVAQNQKYYNFINEQYNHFGDWEETGDVEKVVNSIKYINLDDERLLLIYSKEDDKVILKLNNYEIGKVDLTCFHFVDFNKDGFNDLIITFNRPIIGESEYAFFLLSEKTSDKNSYYYQYFTIKGNIVYCDLKSNSDIFKFTIIEYGCCDNPNNYLIDYQIEKSKYKPYLVTTNKELFIYGTKFPYSFYRKYINAKFIKGSSLRLIPNIAESIIYSDIEKVDNTIAILNEGTTGLILSDSTDIYERTWYFVKVLSSLKPLRNNFELFDDKYSYYLGWILKEEVIK